mgnify:CR=1 FL=1
MDESLIVYYVNAVSVRQALTPDRLRGRVNATMRFIAGGMLPIGALIGGALGTILGAAGDPGRGRVRHAARRPLALPVARPHPPRAARDRILRDYARTRRFGLRCCRCERRVGKQPSPAASRGCPR